MAVRKATYIANTKKTQPSVAEEYEVPSYENHSYFVKKTEIAKAFIERVGLPKEFIERHKPLKG